MKKNILFSKFTLLATLILIPFSVHAEFFSTARMFIVSIFGIVQSMTLIAAGLGLLVFFFGLAQFILKSGDPASHEEGKNKIVWGLVALFVMFSIWGIIGFIQSELGVGGPGGGSDPNFPPGFDDVPLGDPASA